MINILHLTPWPIGGATTYVVNLAKTLEIAGVAHRIVRLAKKTESTKRQLGNYGVRYQNVSFDDALKGGGVWLLASAPTDPEIAKQAIQLVNKSGGACVFHDPHEFGMYPHWESCNMGSDVRVVCIRVTGLSQMPHGEFIPHPYVRVLENSDSKRTKHAISIARISSVKNSLVLLEANEQLPPDRRIDMVGAVNRFWWKFSVQPKHPDWEMPLSAGFNREHGTAARACVGYNYSVDLSIFRHGDGGGTQYTLLESIDAGAIPVMSTEWVSHPGIARDLGFAVNGKTELVVRMLANGKYTDKEIQGYRDHNYAYIDRVHDPRKIGKAYAKFLGV